MSKVIVCFWVNACTWRYSSHYLILINFYNETRKQTHAYLRLKMNNQSCPTVSNQSQSPARFGAEMKGMKPRTGLANNAINQNVNTMLLLALGSNLLDSCYVALSHSKRFAAETISPSSPTQYHVRFTDDHTINITGTTDGSGETFTHHVGASGLPFRGFHAKSIKYTSWYLNVAIKV